MQCSSPSHTWLASHTLFSLLCDSMFGPWHTDHAFPFPFTSPVLLHTQRLSTYIYTHLSAATFSSLLAHHNHLWHMSFSFPKNTLVSLLSAKPCALTTVTQACFSCSYQCSQSHFVFVSGRAVPENTAHVSQWSNFNHSEGCWRMSHNFVYCLYRIPLKGTGGSWLGHRYAMLESRLTHCEFCNSLAEVAALRYLLSFFDKKPEALLKTTECEEHKNTDLRQQGRCERLLRGPSWNKELLSSENPHQKPAAGSKVEVFWVKHT